MKKYLCLFISGILALSGCAGKTDRSEKDKVVVAYVTSWTRVMPDPDRITHINYAFGHVARSFDAVRISNPERLRSITALKETAPSLKVCLSIGGWGSGNFSEMAADDALRKSFAADCARVVKDFNLDGIDIDWEYPTSNAAGISASPDDKDNFTLLMRDIREAIGKDKLLTLATVCSARYIDFPGIMPYVDFVNIMSYDMGWAPRHNAALYRTDAEGNESPIAGGHTADEAVKAHLQAGVPAEKLVMGMPLYGRGDEKTYGAFVDYRETDGPKEGHVEIWDDIARVPYYADENGRLLLGFENIRSITEKCNYINENGLRGGMYWEYAGDNEEGDLTKTIAKLILGR